MLRAGLITVALLTLSRLAGLLREVAIAGVFGVSAQADVVIAALSLPDLLSGVVAAGAVTYVLVPHWLGSGVAPNDEPTRRFVRSLRLVAWALGASLMLWPGMWLQALAGAASAATAQGEIGRMAMQLTGVAVVLAFEAVVPQAKLLAKERWLALHTSNLLISFTLLIVLAVLWLTPGAAWAVIVVAAAAVAAHGLRWLWLCWQVGRIDWASSSASTASQPQSVSWVAAALAVGIPYALPLIARSAASHAGAGEVASFSYAWKLVELPLTLVLQWLGLLALPALANAQSSGDSAAVREHFATVCLLAFALACGCSLALFGGKDVWAALLFGWGKLNGDQLARVGDLAAWGAMSLPALALMSVCLSYAAVAGKLRQYAVSAGCGGLVLLCLGAIQLKSSAHSMQWMLALVLAHVTSAGVFLMQLTADERGALAWGKLLVLTLASAAIAGLARMWMPGLPLLAATGVWGFLALAVLGLAIKLEPGLSKLLRR